MERSLRAWGGEGRSPRQGDYEYGCRVPHPLIVWRRAGTAHQPRDTAYASRVSALSEQELAEVRRNVAATPSSLLARPRRSRIAMGYHVVSPREVVTARAVSW